MPYNGVGLFTSLGAPTFPAVPNTYILASYFNATMNDIFTGLSAVMTRDGQSPMTANLPMGTNKITGLGAGTAPGDAVNVLQAFTAPTISDPTFTGIPVGPTAADGTDTTQLATTAYVIARAMNANLPNQAGNAGKFVTTNGTTASWAAPSVAGANIFMANTFGGF